MLRAVECSSSAGIGVHLRRNTQKLKHIGKGSFEELFKSKKIGILFSWLLDNNFYIHYFNLNVFYWSIVDIVDSIIEKLDIINKRFYIPFHMSVKSDLYKVIISDEATFVTALRNFEYPNIKHERVNEFSKFLIEFVKINSVVLRDDRKYILNKFIESASKVDELFFIMGEKDHILIDDFFTFYLRSVYIFKNSIHIFDNEPQIESIFEQYDFMDKGEIINNYSFVDSKSKVEVQVSDVIAGIFGKYFTFISEIDTDELKVFRAKLNEVQKNNLCLLGKLIDNYNDLSEGFFIVL